MIKAPVDTAMTTAPRTRLVTGTACAPESWLRSEFQPAAHSGAAAGVALPRGR